MTVPYLEPDGGQRCAWSTAAQDLLAYHDTEWGFPVDDDGRLFEKLSLEGFQSGLSWRTILAKRDNFRSAFAGFSIPTVARFDDRDVERLLQDAGIVRHRGKIQAVVNNARRAEELIEGEGSLAAFVWRYEPEVGHPFEQQILSTSPSSVALSKDLRKRGWKFVGPTTAHAFLQAAGLINDHDKECTIWSKAQLAREAFARPGPETGSPLT